MKKVVNLDGREVSYEIRKSARAKNLRITLYNEGRIVVTIPGFLSGFEAEKFVHKKRGWISKKIKGFKNAKRLSKNSPLNERKDYLEKKEKPRKLIGERINYFNRFYGFKFGRVSIKNQKTRWGSCSKKGNLNFSYKAVYLSEDLLDYLVVHELCHLKELNHSNRFWDLVSKTIPDYKIPRKKLKGFLM